MCISLSTTATYNTVQKSSDNLLSYDPLNNSHMLCRPTGRKVAKQVLSNEPVWHNYDNLKQFGWTTIE